MSFSFHSANSPTILAGMVLAFLSSPHPLFAQTTVGSGSMVGTVSDPSGAVISGAQITITKVCYGTGDRADHKFFRITQFGSAGAGRLPNIRFHLNAYHLQLGFEMNCVVRADRWRSSNALPLLKSNSILHPCWSLLRHETPRPQLETSARITALNPE